MQEEGEHLLKPCRSSSFTWSVCQWQRGAARCSQKQAVQEGCAATFRACHCSAPEARRPSPWHLHGLMPPHPSVVRGALLVGVVLLVTAGSGVLLQEVPVRERGAAQPPQDSPEGSRGVAAWQRAGSAAVPVQRLRGIVRICPGNKSAWEVLGVPCQQSQELGERGSPGKGRGDGEDGKHRGGWERRQERERQGGRGRRGKIRGKRSTKGGREERRVGGKRDTHIETESFVTT